MKLPCFFNYYSSRYILYSGHFGFHLNTYYNTPQIHISFTCSKVNMYDFKNIFSMPFFTIIYRPKLFILGNVDFHSMLRLFFRSSPNSHADSGYIWGHNFWTNQSLDPLSTSKWPSEPQFCERYSYSWQKNGQKWS